MSGIEIVVRNCSPDRVTAWLAAVAGPLGAPTNVGAASVYATRLGAVVVTPGMGGPGGVGVWFNAAALPWPSHAACARQAARELGRAVLCDPGADYPDVHALAPVFLEVDAAGERLVIPDD